MLGDPAHRGQRVVDGRGPRVLGREPVVDGDDHDVGAAADPAAGLVVGVEVADHEAAAVEVDQQRSATRRCFTRRSVDPRRPLGHRGLLDLPDLHDVVRLHRVARHRPERLPRHLRRRLVHRWIAGVLDQLEQGGGPGVQRHGGNLAGGWRFRGSSLRSSHLNHRGSPARFVVVASRSVEVRAERATKPPRARSWFRGSSLALLAPQPPQPALSGRRSGGRRGGTCCRRRRG